MERRKYTRVHVIGPVAVTAGTDCKILEGVITNLSVGGMGIISSTPLDVGSDVKITFKLGSRINLENLKGFVTRTEQLGDKFFTYIGINFLNIDSERRVALNKYVLDKKLEQYSFKIGG